MSAEKSFGTRNFGFPEVDRVAQKQAEYHGYTTAGIKEIVEILAQQNKSLAEIAKALQTIVEREEDR